MQRSFGMFIEDDWEGTMPRDSLGELVDKSFLKSESERNNMQNPRGRSLVIPTRSHRTIALSYHVTSSS